MSKSNKNQKSCSIAMYRFENPTCIRNCIDENEKMCIGNPADPHCVWWKVMITVSKC